MKFTRMRTLAGKVNRIRCRQVDLAPEDDASLMLEIDEARAKLEIGLSKKIEAEARKLALLLAERDANRKARDKNGLAMAGLDLSHIQPAEARPRLRLVM